LFAAIFADYLCLLAYICNKWRFVVKPPGTTPTIEFEMPTKVLPTADVVDELTTGKPADESRGRGETKVGRKESQLGDQRGRVDSNIHGDVPRGRTDSQLAAADQQRVAADHQRAIKALVETVKGQLRLRMPQKFETDANGARSKLPNNAGDEYWVLKKHDDKLLRQEGVEADDSGQFAFKDGRTKVMVCFDESLDGGVVAILTKENKTEDQVFCGVFDRQ
jgi:hypothetical protein